MKTDYQMKCYDEQHKLLASAYVSRKVVADAIRNARNNGEYYGRSYRCGAYAYDFGANPSTVYSKVVFTPVRRNSLSGKRTENEAVVRDAVKLMRDRKPLFQARHGVSLFGSEASVSGFNFNS